MPPIVIYTVALKRHGGDCTFRKILDLPIELTEISHLVSGAENGCKAKSWFLTIEIVLPPQGMKNPRS